MLASFLPAGHIRVLDGCADWRAAVALSAEPLLNGGFVSPAYVEAVFAAFAAHGPYFVIAPGVALPHARPGDGVFREGLSLLVVRGGVDFGSENDPVFAVAMLCATDSHAHVRMLAALAGFFGDAAALAALKAARDAAEAAALFDGF